MPKPLQAEFEAAFIKRNHISAQAQPDVFAQDSDGDYVRPEIHRHYESFCAGYYDGKASSVCTIVTLRDRVRDLEEFSAELRGLGFIALLRWWLLMRWRP